TGCVSEGDAAGDASTAAASSSVPGGGVVSDEELATMILRAPDLLTSEYRIRLMAAALAPTVTIVWLKMVNDLAVRGLDKYWAGGGGRPDPRQDAYGDLVVQIWVAFCVAPRDVVFSYLGQTLDMFLEADAFGGSVTVAIRGTATVDYRL